MRDYILLFLNGERVSVRGDDVFLPLSQFLRERRGLMGTKIVCGEGACGACTVLVGEPEIGEAAGLAYKTVNSCLHPVFQMDCRHVVTVEGLMGQGRQTGLSAVQDAMVQNHGAQCGYCTPGVVVSLTGLFDKRCPGAAPIDATDVRDALSGNLCRCTGYLPILQGAEAVNAADYQALATLYAAESIAKELVTAGGTGVSIVTGDGVRQERSLLHTASLDDALRFRADFPAATVVAGGTGLAGGDNVGAGAAAILSLGAVAELSGLSLTPLPPLSQAKEGESGNEAVVSIAGSLETPVSSPDSPLFRLRERGAGGVRESAGELRIGALVTWTQLTAAVSDPFPELATYLQRFGSPQIRNSGTVGGSVAHAEGNADILPLLLMQEATLHLASIDGERVVPIAEFLERKCQPGELLTGVTLPLPAADETLRLYKVRRRQAFDRSVFCAAVAVRRAADGSIESARIACGGVGPKPMRLPRTEAFLRGAPYDEATMRAAGVIAAAEITPVDDAYAGAAYRRRLAANLLIRFFWNVEDIEVGAVSQ